MVLFRKYGRIARLLLIADTLLLYLTDSRCLFHFLTFAPLETFEENYPRLGWLVWAAAKIHWPLLAAISLWYYFMVRKNTKSGWEEPASVWILFLQQLHPKCEHLIQFIYQKVSSIGGNYSISLSTQFATSLFLVTVFSEWYLSLNELSVDFFQQQLRLSHWLIRALLLQLCIVLFLSRHRLKELVTTFFAKKASPFNVAIFRIIIGYNLSGVYSGFIDHHSYWAGFPHHMRVSLPYMDWFIQNVPISPAQYHWAGVFGMVAAKCIMFGFLTRPMLLVNIALGIYIINVPMFFGKLFHMHIWVWFPLLLTFSPCADVLSIDWLIRKLRGRSIDTAPHTKYQLPLTFIWLQLGLIYFFARYVKLNACGLAWALSNSMINQVYESGHNGITKCRLYA
ncbi:MAG: hypothetical protein IPN22_11405 [Bacteroidetes bacterium]|nr:hypothetical protein [Bacteroidota bacterium]